MFEGICIFLRFGNLSFINQFSKKEHRLASTAFDRKGAKFNMRFHDYVKKFFFSKHHNKVIFVLKFMISRSRMTLKSSVLIIKALETSTALLTSAASATLLASTASKAQFPQKTS
jgi:hypothetical protein